MTDIRNPRLLYLKGLLLFVVGCVASTLIVLEQPRLKTVLLLGLAVWGFCRAYYFAFYVIEHYIDDRFKFAGLTAFASYLLRGRR
jgi:hypothetical protein